MLCLIGFIKALCTDIFLGAPTASQVLGMEGEDQGRVGMCNIHRVY